MVVLEKIIAKFIMQLVQADKVYQYTILQPTTNTSTMTTATQERVSLSLKL